MQKINEREKEDKMTTKIISIMPVNEISDLSREVHKAAITNSNVFYENKLTHLDITEEMLEQRNYSDDEGLYSIMSNIEMDLLKLPRNVNDPEVVKNNLEYMKNLAHYNIPTLLIKEILNDNGLLKTIAERSYQHVNHFDKIVLIDNPNPKGYRLTLHSWTNIYSEDILNEELIHNHRFSFWSHIFRGRLISENFAEATFFSVERKMFKKFIYHPSKTGNIHTCIADGEAQLIKLDSSYIDQGKTYYLNYKTTHRVILPTNGNNICTFVLRGPRERDYTNTYNTFYPDRGIESSVSMMTLEQLKNKLINILGE